MGDAFHREWKVRKLIQLVYLKLSRVHVHVLCDNMYHVVYVLVY